MTSAFHNLHFWLCIKSTEFGVRRLRFTPEFFQLWSMWSQSHHLNTKHFSYFEGKATCPSLHCWGLTEGVSIDWGILAVNLVQSFLCEKSENNATPVLAFSKLQDKWRAEEISFKKEEPNILVLVSELMSQLYSSIYLNFTVWVFSKFQFPFSEDRCFKRYLLGIHR